MPRSERVTRTLTPSQMEEYHNPKLLVRPINRQLVEQYAQHIKDGVKLPAVVCGVVHEEGGGERKIMIDGNHIYRACQLANKSWPCEIIEYPTMGAALADQLRRNLTHGLRITTGQRDQRIKDLIEKHNFSVRQVAEAVGMSTASVSRINRDAQNQVRSGRGPAAPQGRAELKPMQPRAFIRVIDALHMTLDRPDSRAQVLAEIYSPDRDPQDIQRIVSQLREVADELAGLVRQTQRPTRVPTTPRREAAVQPAA